MQKTIKHSEVREGSVVPPGYEPERGEVIMKSSAQSSEVAPIRTGVREQSVGNKIVTVGVNERIAAARRDAEAEHRADLIEIGIALGGTFDDSDPFEEVREIVKLCANGVKQERERQAEQKVETKAGKKK